MPIDRLFSRFFAVCGSIARSCSLTRLSNAGLFLAAVMFASGFIPMPLVAQTAEEAAKISASLPAESQRVIERLSSMREIPDGQWRTHAGDLPHGEDPGLDDSSWTPIAKNEAASKDAVWFRQSIVVPMMLNGYDLTGARIWFQFHGYANGPIPQILYFNGRRVAMGDDLEPVVLIDQAYPGERVTVAVKLLHTEDIKRFGGVTMRVDFPDGRPSPEDLREEFLSAALLVPALSPKDPKPLASLNAAIGTVNLKALDAHDQGTFDESLRNAAEQLNVLRPLLQQATLHLTGNSHIDAAWLWPWTETVDVVKRTFGTALQLMYEYPTYAYTQSAAAYNEWIADKYPEMNSAIAERIKEGRWEIVGGMWVEPDLNMPDGESLVRQLLVGKRWYKQAYGVDVRIGWNPDSFGYTWQLPQIFKKSGVDYFVTQKMAWADTNKLPFKFFWWESPDGSKVLTYFPHDYANHDLNPVRLARDFVIAQKQAVGLPSIMDLYGIGDHGGGPTRTILDEGNRWAGKDGGVTGLVTPKMEFGTAQSYFTALEKQIAPESPEWNYSSIAKGYTAPAAVPGMVAIPTWKSELYFEYHRGVMTTQANHKRNMRESEEQVLNAEKWSSLAWLSGKDYPASELTEDWKKVLFNQFHDTAAGSGIGRIYKDAQQDYDVVRWSTNEIDQAALGAVVERIKTDGGRERAIPVVVFNSLGWDRTGSVAARIQLASPEEAARLVGACPAGQLDEITPTQLIREPESSVVNIRFNAELVPALGYKVYRLMIPAEPRVGKKPAACAVQHADEQPDQSGSELTLRTNANGLTVKISKQTGCMTSIRYGKAGYEWLAPGACGNELEAFKDTPKDYDAWNVDPGTFDQPPTLLNKVDKVELIGEQTPTPAVRITRHWQSSTFVQTISLDVNSDQVEVDNTIDWHEAHVLLKAAFPLAAISDHATYEIPYGTIDRATTRNNSWEKAQFEVSALRWADLGNGQHGLSLINESKYGYDAVGNMLRLTLLRSPKWPDPEADMGRHHFRYALYPHSGTWKDALTVRHGWEYNYPLAAIVTTAHGGLLPAEHSFASVEPKSVVLTAVKKAEDANGLIFRAYEWAGKDAIAEFHVPAGATRAIMTNLMEQPEASAALKLEGDVVKVPIHPYEILTIRVDYAHGGTK